MAATSLPPPGSVTASAVMFSPLQIAGRYFALSTSLPVQYRCGDAMSQWTPTAIANEPERERAHSSCRTAVIITSAPAPPYFSSYSSPRKPSAPMRRNTAFGIRPAASHSSTCGMTSFSTKARTVARNIWCCSLKTFTRGPPSGPTTIQWARVAGERSRLLPVLLTAIVGLGALSIDMFLPALPAMTVAFGSDAATAQLTVTLFLAGLAVSQLLWGPLSDRLGRRRVLLAGLGVYAVAGTVCAFAPSMGTLVASRVVQAMGA